VTPCQSVLHAQVAGGEGEPTSKDAAGEVERTGEFVRGASGQANIGVG
jgi:hypothetical protein